VILKRMGFTSGSAGSVMVLFSWRGGGAALPGLGIIPARGELAERSLVYKKIVKQQP
jgi:hypothetical protein